MFNPERHLPKPGQRGYSPQRQRKAGAQSMNTHTHIYV